MIVPNIVLHPYSQVQLEAFIAAPAHAVLLSGPKGIGKTYVASVLSAQFLGTSLDDLKQHAYYHVVAPKNNTTTIEQVRELTSLFTLKVPGAGAIKRVAVMQDAETMGSEAQNALLKLLEEPPTDSVLILTSSQPAHLLATVRSRLQQLQLPAPNEADMLKHFIATGYDETAARAALLRNGSNIAEAKRILEGSDGESGAIIALVKQTLSVSPYERLLLVDSLAKQKDQAQLFTETLAAVATASLEAAAVKGATTTPRWRGILQAAYSAQEALEKSGNAKLVLTELMLAL